MRIIFVLLSLSLVPMAAHAAVPQKNTTIVKPAVDSALLEVLKLPIDNRVQAARVHGERGFSKLSKMAFNRTLPLEVRWRALTVLPRLNPELSEKIFETAMGGEEWYMRNAAAVSLTSFPREYAMKWSERLLSDPALVVRTAAVQNLIRLNGHETASLLWSKLNSRENFRNGESLWVRRHIARALAQFARPGDEARYVQMLNDKDSRLHVWAIRGLEKSTGQAPAEPTASVIEQKQKWLAWWGNHKAG